MTSPLALECPKILTTFIKVKNRFVHTQERFSVHPVNCTGTDNKVDILFTGFSKTLCYQAQTIISIPPLMSLSNI